MGQMNYAAQYGRELANAYPYLSYFGDLWNAGESQRYKPLQGKTVYIPSMSTTGAKAVNRDAIDGNFTRNFDLNWEAHTLQMDREWDTLIDPLDMMETNEVATIANVTQTFNQFQKIPEQDAYMASKLAGFAADFGGIVTTVPSADNILGLWDNALAYMTDQRVNRDRVRCKVIPAVYKLLKQATGMTRFIEVTQGINNVDRNVAKLDGVLIEEVPSDMMKTAYDFTVGFAPSVSAAQINMLFYDSMAIAAPIIYDTSMISAPTAQSKGKYLYYERYYYDVFILRQRMAGVYALVSSGPSLGSLNVTSVAGKASGDTKIDVTGDLVGAAGTALKYCADQDAAISLTYGAVPDNTKTWVDMPEIPINISDLIASKVMTVAQINKETGFAIAGGNATQVVRA